MICKISGNTKRDIKFIWRLIMHHQMKGHVDEFMSRIESSFYKEIIPLMQDTGYCSPKIYFNGKLFELFIAISIWKFVKPCGVHLRYSEKNLYKNNHHFYRIG